MLITEIEDYLKQLHTTEVPPDFLKVIQRKLLEAPDHVDDPNVLFRASRIGRPWCLQMVERWYGGQRTLYFNNAMSMINGNIIQEVLAFLFNAAGYQVQQEVQLSHLGVAGHADIVIEDKDTLLVIECKSMAPHMIKGFVQYPNDDFGYLSQLSFYAGCLRRENFHKNVQAAFVLFDRGASKFTLLPITWDAMEMRIQRYELMVPVLTKLQPYDIDTLLNVTKVPPAVLGKLPKSMQYTRWASYFYNCDSNNLYDVKTTYQIVNKFMQLKQSRADSKEVF